jgi:glycosyltransferase involved in cell wall biosynthesis
MRNLRSEREIIQTWKGDLSKPLVSVCCSAYNHEEFIEDALEGFLIQETVFPFEILIHDDASTDKTADIIRKYEKIYPNLIRPIYQIENQFSQGKSPGYFNLDRAIGKYIAFCEGDDYWLSAEKLQKQFDILEKNQDIGLIHTDVKYVDAKKQIIIPPSGYKRFNNRIRKGDLFWDLLLYGNTILTVSVMLRKKLLERNPKWFHFDYWIFLEVSRKSNVAYINEKIVSYRIHQGGLMLSNPAFAKNRFEWVRLDMLYRYLFKSDNLGRASKGTSNYILCSELLLKLTYSFWIKQLVFPKQLFEIFYKKPSLIWGILYNIPRLIIFKIKKLLFKIH